MKTIHRFLTVLFLGFVLTTCAQEPLFWYIHEEYPPIESIIGGAPTQIVYDGIASLSLYVANRKSLWKYDTTSPNPEWVKLGLSSGFIKAIAFVETGADQGLYVLFEDGSISKSADGNAPWTGSTTVSGAQQIYGAGNTLFIGNGSAVYNGAGTQITGSPDPGGLLSGAAWDGTNYYISTANMWGNEKTGIFTVSGTTATKVYHSSSDVSVKGIIAAGSTVVAVNSEGQIIYKDGNISDFSSPISPGVSFTGGMAVWYYSGDKKILLGLLRGSGTFPYGYRELDLDASGDVDSSAVFVPGDTDNSARTTSIDPGSRETSAIGKYPVTSLYVIPGSTGDSSGRPVIVASTQKDGVWSYRVRRGSPQWNGEDNSN
jgi:hypothetical protein